LIRARFIHVHALYLKILREIQINQNGFKLTLFDPHFGPQPLEILRKKNSELNADGCTVHTCVYIGLIIFKWLFWINLGVTSDCHMNEI